MNEKIFVFDLKRFANISNFEPYKKISGDVHSTNLITNSAPFVTIEGGNATNVINNTGVETAIEGGNSGDCITSSASNVTINGGNGNDSITNRVGNNANLIGGNGDDCIVSDTSNNVTISGGNGDDFLNASGNNISIYGGNGNDTISVTGFSNGVTVSSGNGDDTIVTDNCATVQFIGGNDRIKTWNERSMISLSSSETYTRETVSGDVVIKTANGTLTLENAANKIINVVSGKLSVGGGGSDPSTPKIGINIKNSTSNTIISGTPFDDTINNRGDRVTIVTSSGNDSIFTDNSTRTSIESGDGDDTVWGRSNDESIETGAGNDKISVIAYDASADAGEDDDFIFSYTFGSKIKGGAGNDTISIYSAAHDNVIPYASGDGNDLVYGFGTTTTLSISGGKYSTQTSGSDVIVSVGMGKITLVGANNGNELHIAGTLDGGSGGNSSTSGSGSNVSAQDVVKKFMDALDKTSYSGVAAVNQAVYVASGGYFADLDDLIDHITDDCEVADSSDQFLKNSCGIVLDNDDTGAITGSDAGSSTTKTNSSIVPEEGKLHNFTGNSFTVNGLKFKLGDFQGDQYNPNAISYNDLTDYQKFIWQAAETWWIKNSLDLIAESYGDSFGYYTTNSSAPVKEIYLGFRNAPKNSLAATPMTYFSTTGALHTAGIWINTIYYDGVEIGNVDGKSSKTTFLLDRTLAHELTHFASFNNIKFAADLPNFLKEGGMAELTHGIDDLRKQDIRTLASNPDKLRQSLALTSSNVSVSGVGSPSYAGGYILMRYFAKQASDHFGEKRTSSAQATTEKNSVSIKGTTLTLAKNFIGMLDLTDNSFSKIKTVDAKKTEEIFVVGNSRSNSIATGAGNDTISANTGNDTISAGGGKNLLLGDAGNDVLIGGSGSDTEDGGSGDDLLTGGGGNNIFVFGDNFGNDTITDYKSGDKIKLGAENASVTSFTTEGNDLVLNVGGGIFGTSTITVKDGVGQKITIVDAKGKSSSKIYKATSSDAAKSLTVTKNATLSSAYANADASKLTKAVKITGNSAANSIVGGSRNDSLNGGKGNDTLDGAAGDDVLTGGNGSDIFVWSAGNDIVTDYGTGDKISVVGAAISKSTLKGSDVVFTVGKNTSLTVKNGRGRKLTLVDTKGKSFSTIVGGAATSTTSSDKKTLSVTNNDKATITIDSDVKNVDASKRTKKVQLIGNDLDNSIVGGAKNSTILGGGGKDSINGGDKGFNYLDGGTGADKIWSAGKNTTLTGGAGNDSLWGDAGADKFIYSDGDGKDVIFGFDGSDLLEITGVFTGSYNKTKKEIYFKVGSTASAITLRDFTAATFNVNDTAYKISGTKLVKK